MEDGGEKDVTTEPIAIKNQGIDVAKTDEAAPKWDKVDDLGLPIVDKDKEPELAKEVEVVRTLVK